MFVFQNMKSSSLNYDVCGVMLGTGSLLAWLGVLRYVGFFEQFNVSKILLQLFYQIMPSVTLM